MTRRFVDAPTTTRCTAVIVLKDGSTAQCGRHQKDGTLCTQHAKIKKRPETDAAKMARVFNLPAMITKARLASL